MFLLLSDISKSLQNFTLPHNLQLAAHTRRFSNRAHFALELKILRYRVRASFENAKAGRDFPIFVRSRDDVIKPANCF